MNQLNVERVGLNPLIDVSSEQTLENVLASIAFIQETSVNPSDDRLELSIAATRGHYLLLECARCALEYELECRSGLGKEYESNNLYEPTENFIYRIK